MWVWLAFHPRAQGSHAADAVSLDELAARILAFQSSYEILAQPFEWKLTRADLARLLERLEQKTSGRLREAA